MSAGDVERGDGSHMDAPPTVIDSTADEGTSDGPWQDATADALADVPGTQQDATADTLTDAPSPVPDGITTWQTLVTFSTASEALRTFGFTIIKSGDVLRWDLGDGTVIDSNAPEHQYLRESGQKTVLMVSRDGPLGITAMTAEPGAELVGEIPPELGHLSNLEVLSLGGQFLTGTIPLELGQLSRLKTLALLDNNLTGDIPSTLGELTSLEVLVFYRNRLTGTLPPELGQLSDLVVLGLNDNQLSGDVPAEFVTLTNLRELNLGSNRLTGYGVGVLRGMTDIDTINLGGNRLSQAAVDAVIDDVHQARDSHILTSKHLYLSGGSNATPGIAAQAQVDELRNSYGWDLRCNGY
ncbi:MAG: hypothetical protein JRH20_08540 [Deltaproteobacteria bacterium]|nr:hypothetical protein [Deltaproteobacteria bacterium]